MQGTTAKPKSDEIDLESERILKLLLKEVSTKKAAALTAEITGLRKNKLYQHALSLTSE